MSFQRLLCLYVIGCLCICNQYAYSPVTYYYQLLIVHMNMSDIYICVIYLSSMTFHYAPRP